VLAMKRRTNWQPIRALAIGATIVALAISQVSHPRPMSLRLECSVKDCDLLQGAPQTSGMRSGFVRLKPGESVGWHTTDRNEESLVVLRGEGSVFIEGQAEQKLIAPALAYIPTATRHNVLNSGKQLLEYVYVVAPVK
jgi:mannose-6-phosphate isomerase-like protein (cupin superfamily)